MHLCTALSTPGMQDRGVFHHPSNPNWKLSIPNFSVRAGEVVAVVGRVGAGKSSLMSALLGNMVRESGGSTVSGRVGYVPQNPWMQNMSLRDNVLFGEEMEYSRYDEVISACALTLDLEILAQVGSVPGFLLSSVDIL